MRQVFVHSIHSINMQPRNLRYSLRHNSRLGPDSFYNLHTLAYEVGGDVRQITTFPIWRWRLGWRSCWKTCRGNCSLTHLRRSYDTTFQVGNFYLSFAIYRMTIFKGDPVFLFSSSYMKVSLPGHTGLSSSI